MQIGRFPRRRFNVSAVSTQQSGNVVSSVCASSFARGALQMSFLKTFRSGDLVHIFYCSLFNVHLQSDVFVCWFVRSFVRVLVRWLACVGSNISKTVGDRDSVPMDHQ